MQFPLNLLFLHLFAGSSTTPSSNTPSLTTPPLTTLRPDPTTTDSKIKHHKKIKQIPYRIIIGTTMGVLLVVVSAIFLVWHKSRKQKQYMVASSVCKAGMYFHDRHTNCFLAEKMIKLAMVVAATAT